MVQPEAHLKLEMNVCRLLGVVSSADFHQAKHALEVSHFKAFHKFLEITISSDQVLSGEHPEQFVFGGEHCVPMMECQWAEYVEKLRKVLIMNLKLIYIL